MDFAEVLKKRKSIREYQEKAVSEETIKSVLRLASTSPSAGNLQARSVVVVKSKEIKERLSDACLGQESVAEAGVIFVITANKEESIAKYGKRGQDLYSLQDATIFASYLQLAATSFGLASVWVGAFDESMVQDILVISKDYRPIAIIPVGYPAGGPRETDRKSLDELVIKRL